MAAAPAAELTDNDKLSLKHPAVSMMTFDYPVEKILEAFSTKVPLSAPAQVSPQVSAVKPLPPMAIPAHLPANAAIPKMKGFRL